MATASRVLTAAMTPREADALFFFTVYFPFLPVFWVSSTYHNSKEITGVGKSVRFSGKSVAAQGLAPGRGRRILTTNSSPSWPMWRVPPYFSVMYRTLRRPKPW